MLGIDTGGTYTDAVIMDWKSGHILASAKALTTHDDLSRGIDAAIAALSGVELAQVRLVGLSTTLATNALVEGRGGRVGLILIGYDPRLIERWGFRQELAADPVIYVQGGHDLAGREAAPLDEAVIQRAVERYAGQVDAWAISAYFGVRNPDHEQRARALVRALSGLPVTCAHELTGELNSIRRATTVALNARLIPLIQHLIRAVQGSLARHRIPATLMITRGDGALLRAEVALEHPVETILSGPAASIVGARRLTGLDNAIVVDMGGTTTDIAMLVGGRPGIRDDGAQVGRWRTLVRAVDAQTTGLGGDSLVRIIGRQIHIGPERAIPLCMMAALHPQAGRELERALRRNGAWETPCLFALVGSAQGWELTETERQILSALEEGPISLDRLTERVPRARLYLGRPNRLEQHGLLRRVSFTPTDALHVEGRYRAWDAAVAQRMAAHLGQRMGLSADQLSQMVREAVIRRLAMAILNRVLSLHGESDDVWREPVARRLVERALEDIGLPELDVRLQLRQPIVALGAPAQAYFDQVAARLHAELILPEHAPVANAVGAVSGSVMHTCEMRLVAQYEVTGITGYTLHSSAGLWEFKELEQALAFARERGRELAIQGARAAGAATVQVEEEALEERATALDGEPLYLGTRLRFTGIGRPDLG